MSDEGSLAKDLRLFARSCDTTPWEMGCANVLRLAADRIDAENSLAVDVAERARGLLLRWQMTCEDALAWGNDASDFLRELARGEQERGR